MLEQYQRHRALPAAAVAVHVIDAVGRTDQFVRQFRIRRAHGCSPSPFSDVCAEVSLLTSVLVIRTSVGKNWHRYQRVAPADPSRPWESLALPGGLPALVFRYGGNDCGQMSRFKPLTR